MFLEELIAFLCKSGATVTFSSEAGAGGSAISCSISNGIQGAGDTAAEALSEATARILSGSLETGAASSAGGTHTCH